MTCMDILSGPPSIIEFTSQSDGPFRSRSLFAHSWSTSGPSASPPSGPGASSSHQPVSYDSIGVSLRFVLLLRLRSSRRGEHPLCLRKKRWRLCWLSSGCRRKTGRGRGRTRASSSCGSEILMSLCTVTIPSKVSVVRLCRSYLTTLRKCGSIGWRRREERSDWNFRSCDGPLVYEGSVVFFFPWEADWLTGACDFFTLLWPSGWTLAVLPETVLCLSCWIPWTNSLSCRQELLGTGSNGIKWTSCWRTRQFGMTMPSIALLIVLLIGSKACLLQSPCLAIGNSFWLRVLKKSPASFSILHLRILHGEVCLVLQVFILHKSTL